MCKTFEEIEVKSFSMIDTVDSIDCVQKRYTCILADVIKHAPLNMLGQQINASCKVSPKHACIHDFNSASLMMDICT